MTDKPGIGKNLYNQEIVRGRNAAKEARRALRRILDEQPGPAMTNMLLAAAALSLGEIEAVLNELDKIGRQAKNAEKNQK
jgi:predicted Zn-dependent protease